VYPGLLTGLAEQVLRSGPEPKRKLISIARAELARAGLPMSQLVRDLVDGGRAFAW
jgi:hypothetical protein